GNTIGSLTSTNSIIFRLGDGSGGSYWDNGMLGIWQGGYFSSKGSIKNNNIGGITFISTTTKGNQLLYPIRLTGTLAADFEISGNTIGSTTTANSIQYSNSAGAMATGSVIFRGMRIQIGTGAFTVTIKNN